MTTAEAVARLLGNTEHPPPFWCPQCGALECGNPRAGEEACGCGHLRVGPGGQPPVDRPRLFGGVR